MKTRDTIRSYKDYVFLDFVKRGKNFTLKVPHLDKWAAIIRFLRKRGFKVGENQSYKEHYESISKYHKIGSKGDVRVLMEIHPARIEVKFGHVKNLWTGIAQSFWDRGDDRHVKLTYLQYKSVELEIKRLVDHCMKWDIDFLQEKEGLAPVEYILANERDSFHFHGEVKCLDDIRKALTEDSYNYKHNSTDANGKKIICGDTKCFYDGRTKRIFRGVVWHNINNMWWVIMNNTLTNTAAFDLFDYDPALPKRDQSRAKAKIEQCLKKYEAARDYKRCMSIQSAIDKRFPKESVVV